MTLDQRLSNVDSKLCVRWDFKRSTDDEIATYNQYDQDHCLSMVLKIDYM